MSSKTISLSEEAYRKLKSLKDEGESFTDVIKRLTGKYSNITKFSGS
ncbi:MAG: antitoxin VapB family protein, partial [Candidatus Nanohaloarchaea archaeon]|nr:antitoxin VapB family protein [Candidatus Nanohaloarchaea archaeon]